jgi:hypothetical protein
MEAAAPTPNPHLAESEARWMRPAGIFALAGVLLIVISTLLRQSAGPVDGVTEAAKLRQYAELGNGAVIGDAIALVGLLLLIVPLYFLFQAAAARAPKIRRGFVVFIVLGPLLLGIQGLVGTIARESAGDQYVEEYPTATASENREPAESSGDGNGNGGSTTSDSGTTTSGTTTSGTTTGSGSDSASAESPREKRANEIIDESRTLQLAAVMGLVGALGFVFAMVYTSLWSFRVGLLTRFWGTLGMALGVALVFLGSLGFLGLLIWFAALGMMYIGFFPGGRPPAWAAGMAIPWPKPQPRGAADDKDQPLEGSGREVEEPALPEGSEPDGPDQDSPPSTGGDSSGKSS